MLDASFSPLSATGSSSNWKSCSDNNLAQNALIIYDENKCLKSL